MLIWSSSSYLLWSYIIYFELLWIALYWHLSLVLGPTFMIYFLSGSDSSWLCPCLSLCSISLFVRWSNLSLLPLCDCACPMSLHLCPCKVLVSLSLMMNMNNFWTIQSQIRSHLISFTPINLSIWVHHTKHVSSKSSWGPLYLKNLFLIYHLISIQKRVKLLFNSYLSLVKFTSLTTHFNIPLIFLTKVNVP